MSGATRLSATWSCGRLAMDVEAAEAAAALVSASAASVVAVRGVVVDVRARTN